MLEIGSRFGDFTVVALIGRGAMGEVYRISDGEAETLSEAVGGSDTGKMSEIDFGDSLLNDHAERNMI